MSQRKFITIQGFDLQVLPPIEKEVYDSLKFNELFWPYEVYRNQICSMTIELIEEENMLQRAMGLKRKEMTDEEFKILIHNVLEDISVYQNIRKEVRE